MEKNKAEKESKPVDEQANESVVDNLPETPVAETEPQENEPEPAATDVLKDELASQKDKYLRLYSEFENFRRRTAKEKLDMIQSANEALLKTLLPVVDDFERAEKSIDKNSKDLEGFLLILNKFKKILDQYGVKVMEIKTGDGFDADFHEAITQMPAPDEKLKGKIIDVIEKGYQLNDKVIRFAKVVVGG